MPVQNNVCVKGDNHTRRVLSPVVAENVREQRKREGGVGGWRGRGERERMEADEAWRWSAGERERGGGGGEGGLKRKKSNKINSEREWHNVGICSSYSLVGRMDPDIAGSDPSG